MKLKEIAARINAHVKRWENDPAINVPVRGHRPYFLSGASASGSRVMVSYVNYQGHASLRKAEAEAYLAALDGGFVGKYYSWASGNKK